MVNNTHQAINSRVYALFWRWHFITGFFAVPILVVAALTGAVITYEAELHAFFYPQLDFSIPAPPAVSLDKQVEALKSAYPDVILHGIDVFPSGSDKSTIFRITYKESTADFFNPWDLGHAYVNPYSGEVLGLLSDSHDILGFITTLHKSFFLKLPGELAVDIATSWGVISLLAGLYLWWPRRKEKLWGVWLPRLTRGKWNLLRDLHTVPSLYISPVAVAVMASGVLMGLSASPILLTVILTRQFPTELLSPKSARHEGLHALSVSDILARMGPHPGPNPYTIAIPSDPDGAYIIHYGLHTDVKDYRVAVIDQYTGAFIVDYSAESWPAGSRFYYLYIFNEVLHRGTYWGSLSQFLTCIACILVAFMSITSWLMWLRRKPAGRWGFPREVHDASFPRWSKALFFTSLIFFPFVAIMLVLAIPVRWVIHLIRPVHVEMKTDDNAAS